MGEEAKPLNPRNKSVSQHDEITTKESEHSQHKRQNDTFESPDARCILSSTKFLGCQIDGCPLESLPGLATYSFYVVWGSFER